MRLIPERSWLVALAIGGTLSGCVVAGGPSQPAGLPSPSPQMKLSVANYTTIPVTLVVNGRVIETIPPGGCEDPIRADLPALPWAVETRSPSGRPLSTMTVHGGDFWQTMDASGNGEVKGDAVRVDLSCGRLDVWYGTPMLGPPFSPGPSGDCA
jgi:hypothetical protein